MDQHVDDSSRLLVAAAAGDREAFARFYRDHAVDLLRYFYRRTACAETAADLTAETFAAALASLRSFRPGSGSGRMWVFGIAGHQLSRFNRRRAADTRMRRRLGLPTQTTLDAESHDLIEQLVDLSVFRAQVLPAMERLSPRLAEAIELRIGADLSYRDVAKRLGCSEAAARARVSRALRELADDVEDRR